MLNAVRFTFVSVAATCVFFMPVTASAQDTQAVRQEIDQLRRDFEALKQEYGQRLAALEAKLGAAEGATPAAPAGAAPAPATPPPVTPAEPTAQVPPGAAGAGGPTGALPVYGAAAAGSKVFNPDMAMIGDFLGAGGSSPFRFADIPPMEMHESEASFQAVVDPYARADFFVSFGQEGVELEEGYATFTSLPGGLLTRVGKMRAAFGKVNSLHNHVLPWADRPLVNEELLNGEDGVDDAGVSVARLIPNPWIFLEATGQVFRGNSGDLLQNYDRKGLTYVGHLRGYHDLTENANLDLGLSYLFGNVASSLGYNNLKTHIVGLDATYRWKPLQRAIYTSFVARTEWMWSRREFNPFTPAAHGDGMYVSGDYQFARRWFAGARFDRSRAPLGPDGYDTSESLVLTYWPSEFSQLRAQYRHANLLHNGVTTQQDFNQLLVQLQFSIGAHGAHPF